MLCYVPYLQYLLDASDRTLGTISNDCYNNLGSHYFEHQSKVVAVLNILKRLISKFTILTFCWYCFDTVIITCLCYFVLGLHKNLVNYVTFSGVINFHDKSSCDYSNLLKPFKKSSNEICNIINASNADLSSY